MQKRPNIVPGDYIRLLGTPEDGQFFHVRNVRETPEGPFITVDGGLTCYAGDVVEVRLESEMHG